MFSARTQGKNFTYTENAFYGSRNLFFIKSDNLNLKYITAFLNSLLIDFFMHERLKLTGDLLQIDKNQFFKIPIHKPMEAEQKPFIDLVDTILTKKKAGQDTSTEEAKIDKLVYKLYDLSPDEIQIIEESLQK